MNHATSCSFDDLFIMFLIVFLTSYAFIGLRERSCRGWKRFFWWIEERLHHAFIMGSCSLKTARRCATWYSNAWRCEQIYANSKSFSLSPHPILCLTWLLSCGVEFPWMMFWVSDDSKTCQWQLHWLALTVPCRREKRCTLLLLGITEVGTIQGVGSLWNAVWRSDLQLLQLSTCLFIPLTIALWCFFYIVWVF